MKVEGFGAATIDPSRRWLVYERIRPYDQIDDYSFRTYAYQKSGHQLWRYDLRKNGKPKLLPGLDPGPSSYLQEFSPTGRYLAVMQYQFGELTLNAYDTARERAVRFDRIPAFSKAGEHNPIWVSNEELVYAALREGERPALTSVRAHTGKVLTKAWTDAWRGQTVTANEVRALPEDHSDRQEDGVLLRANAKSGETQIIADGLYADLRLSPNGRDLAALSVSKPRPMNPTLNYDADLRRYHLRLINLATGEEKRLAPGLEFFPYTITWSPDGRRLAAYGWRSGTGPREGRFYVIDVNTRNVTRLDHNGLELTSERERGWLQRPERAMFLGDGLAVYARPISQGESQGPRFSYQEFHAKGLPRADWHLVFKDGTSRNLTSGLSGVSRVPIHAGLNHITIAAQDGVYRLYANGERQRLTPELPGRFQFMSPGTFATRSSVIRPEFEDEAMFVVHGDETAKIVMVDLGNGHEGETFVVDAPTANAAPLAGSLAAGAVLFRSDEGQVSSLLVTKVGADTPPRNIATINDHLAKIDLGEWKVVSYEVDDPEGKAPSKIVESCVLLPPGFEPERPPPLIVEVYPNVGPSCKDPDRRRIRYPNFHSAYLWGGRGFSYARLSTPLDLIRTDEGPIAGMDEVINAGVDALIKAGIADPARVALRGFSQGGVSALYVASQSNKFKAVIALNSWADLFSHYFGPLGVYSLLYGETFGADAMRYDMSKGTPFGISETPFANPEIYYLNSPVFLAPKIDAPVLLISSDMDDFSMSQFDEMFGALKRAGKEARYVRYWGEGHSPSSPANIRDMWKRFDEFLLDFEVAPSAYDDGAVH